MQNQQKTQLSKERIINSTIVEFGANGYKKGALNNICASGIPINIVGNLIYTAMPKGYFGRRYILLFFCNNFSAIKIRRN